MGKTTAPLLSFGASGQIAKTQVYSHWRGVPYARKYVIPANPKSSAQVSTRSVFTWASNVWKLSSSLVQAPWTAFAKGQPLTNRNAFIGKNVAALRSGTDLTDSIWSPGANGGLSALTCAPTGGSGEITFAMTSPTPPAGWTLSGFTVGAIKAGDPHTATVWNTFSAAATSPYTSATLTGLASGSYETFGFPIWTKPDGSLAYGASINGTATVS